MKKFCDPPAFSWPPYSEENDSPLIGQNLSFIYIIKIDMPQFKCLLRSIIYFFNYIIFSIYLYNFNMILMRFDEISF